MTKPAAKQPVGTTQCLGCRDCKGLCRAVIDLAVVPETVLHRTGSAAG